MITFFTVYSKAPYNKPHVSPTEWSKVRGVVKFACPWFLPGPLLLGMPVLRGAEELHMGTCIAPSAMPLMSLCVCVWLHYGRRVAFWPAGSIESLVAACAGGCFPSAGPVPAVRRPFLAPVDRRKAWWRFGSATAATPLLNYLAFINGIAYRPSPCLALFGMPVLLIGREQFGCGTTEATSRHFRTCLSV